jgi:translation initiation factor 1 (eIF-1/SUI1)
MIGQDQAADIYTQLRALGKEVTRLEGFTKETETRLAEIELALATLLNTMK